jgi:APA family basic amino acid/polyamine antiporter
MSFFLTRTKSIDLATTHDESRRLKPTLSWPHLIALGVGAIVGTGIYTLTGIAAALAGPGMIYSFLLCGVLVLTAALCYAEMATMVPASGSAFTYSYTALGETLAWVVGWALILEYAVGASAVAVGWSGHANEFLHWAHDRFHTPLLADNLTKGLFASAPIGELVTGHVHPDLSKAFLDVPAMFIVLVVTGLLALGTRESATVNIVLVTIKLAALLMFVVIAAPYFDSHYLQPIAPQGWGATPHADGRNYGVLGAAGLVFFAFYGFDAVSTAAEETKRPERDMTIGIVGSMFLCTAIYIGVALTALGAMYYTGWADDRIPLVTILKHLHAAQAATWLTVAVLVAVPTVILVLLYGQSRIFFVMSRDGLLPEGFSKVNPKTKTPIGLTIGVGVLVALIAGTVPLADIGELANAGTLAAFIAVALSVIVLRFKDPGRKRVFKTPLWWLTAPLCVIGCAYLFIAGLPKLTHQMFLIWGGVGLVFYLLYGAWRSKLARGQQG